MITVGELKKLLENYHDTSIVVIAKDEEGNAFSPLANTMAGRYNPITKGQGVLGFSGRNALVLWPTN